MSTDIRDTIHERALLVRAALAKRDREWEECLKLIDDRPPLTPDPEWFREWVARVEPEVDAELEALKNDLVAETVEDFQSTLLCAVANLDDDRAWSKGEIEALIKKAVDSYSLQA